MALISHITNYSAQLAKIADYLASPWYWSCEPKRDVSAKLGVSWLARIHDIRQRLCAIAEAGTQPATALWGPSQAGKSSLLAPYIDLKDSKDDPAGCASAISWSDQASLRFKGDANTPVALNPYNQGKDATGCVTRYTLQSSVPDPEHPVSIKLCQPPALLHALATGYLSECDTRNHDGEETFWNFEALQDIIADLPAPETDTPDPKTFARLLELTRIVQLLIDAQLQRYTNLSNRKNSWKQFIQSDLLNCHKLTASARNLDTFTRILLWDNHPTFNDFHAALLASYEKFHSRFGEATLVCSLDTAAILINIDSYKYLREPDNSPQTQQFIQRIRSLRCLHRGNCIAISPEGSAPFCDYDQEYGHFTALILELVIPINANARLQDTFRNFLLTSDILDFPGVAQEDHSQATMLLPDDIRSDDHRLVTQIMKRGKTASIVSSYASSCQIDQFVLALRSKKDLINAGQLSDGIRQWWMAASGYDCNYPKPDSRPPLPLAIVASFSALWINDIIASGISSGGLANIFKDLSELAPLDRPPHSTLFLTTYKYLGCIFHLPNGEPIRDLNCPELATAISRIRQDDFFHERIGSQPVSNQSFNAMIQDEDGGTGFLFQNLTRAIQPEQRQAKLLQRLLAAARDLLGAIEIACPKPENSDNERQEFIEHLAQTIMAAAQCPTPLPGRPDDWQDNQAWVAWLIRQLRHIPAAALASFNAGNGSSGQLISACDELLARFPNALIQLLPEPWPFAVLGLETPEVFLKLLKTLTPATFRNHLEAQRPPIPVQNVLATWYTLNIATIHPGKRLPALARTLENIIWHGYCCLEYDARHSTLSIRPETASAPVDLKAALEQIESYFSSKDLLYGNDNASTPEMDYVIRPFVERLRHALQHDTGKRQPQSGDDIIMNNCRPPCETALAELEALCSQLAD